jgi:hypothetical protein
MFFHVDESGHTGNNLFDVNQPRLSYGLLSSKTNVDALGTRLHKEMLSRIGAPQLHANELGLDGLAEIATLLCELQHKMRFEFDYYYIVKPDFAVTMLFEAIFDAGLNEAVKWDAYWTPLRYLLLLKLNELLDEPLLRRAWLLCTVKHVEKHKEEIVDLLIELKRRAEASALDLRSKELMVDAFRFGIAKPLDLDFGAPDPRFISPNAVAFQFIVLAIARRLKKARRNNATSIVVDQQKEFNRSQREVHELYQVYSNAMTRISQVERQFLLSHPFNHGLDEDTILRRGIPERAISVLSSSNSIGLQLVDVYLWIVSRVQSGAPLCPELGELVGMFLNRTITDGISLDGLARRFATFERTLPDLAELSQEQINAVKTSVETHREKVQSLGI